ncbi:uncharacterized protein LOC123292386 [Chrysoperla carnea]|uniref:uncharacterized protein LOC123292386 n=1 Tax=Chrysoperla carnea TaxID=189513 RepID=UPI001D06BDD4|nr:uncharacterized protein LOC123292386 [Chrysoperla carnea]
MQNFCANITVEPMMACYIMPSVLSSLAVQNLNLEKACRVNLNFGSDVCDALSRRDTANYTFEETQVQQLVTGLTIWKTALQSSIPVILMLFVGSWSDRHSCRKPFMIIPVFGELMTTLSLILCTYFFYQLPVQVNGLVEGLIPALSGGWFTMFMATFAYIADVTTEDERTLRIGVVNVFCSLGVPVGLALSGILYMEIGFYGVFSISSIMYVFSIIYGIVYLKEKKKIVPMEEKLPSTNEKDSKSSVNICAFLRDFFDFKNILETFRVTFKSGENGRKKKVITIMIVVCVVIGPMHGEMAVMYLFTRYKYNWNEVDFSLFSTYSVIVNLIGTSVSVGVFSHVLKIDDTIIGALSCTSKILSSFVYAFAPNTFVFYLGSIVEILNGTSFIAMRSMVSKLVPNEELGQVMSIFGVCEALMPLVYGPMYGAVYSKTMHTMPGAFFVLGGLLTIPALVIFLWLYTEMQKNPPKSNDVKEGITNKAFEAGELAVVDLSGAHFNSKV